MYYTTLALVKDELHGAKTTRDTLITRQVKSASRAIDRHCTGVVPPASDNYFELATVTDELLTANVFKGAQVRVFPHKPAIASVASLSWRALPSDAWLAVDSDAIEIENGVVIAYTSVAYESVRVKISYSGGLAADVDSLPEDLVEAATVLAARYFREAATGLSDQIGMDELGLVSYVRAMPARVKQLLAPFARTVPW